MTTVTELSSGILLTKLGLIWKYGSRMRDRSSVNETVVYIEDLKPSILRGHREVKDFLFYVWTLDDKS